MVGEIAGKHFPKAIYSSYFQTNTQTFMLAVLAAFLKSTLLKSVLVCIEIEEEESRGRGTVIFFAGMLSVLPAPTVLTIATLPSKILPH